MSVTIGCLDGSLRATVDDRGRVQLVGRRWSLGWAVRSDDGWHLPESTRPASLSQQRLDGAPVVETALRVPSGQAVHRAFAARAADGTEAVVVEVENRSRFPIAVALCVGDARRISLTADTIHVDGEIALGLPRAPSRTAGSLDDLLEAGGSTVWNGDVRSRRRDGYAAFVLPLAHTASVRVVVGADVDGDRLPDADAVVAGWVSHAEAGLRFEVPDGDVVERARADLADLLLADDLDVGAVLALDRFGHHGVARRALQAMVEDQRLHLDGGAPVVALAEHHRLTGADELVAAAVGPVAAAAHRLRRRGDAAVQLAAADLLDAAGQPEAAALCRVRADELTVGGGAATADEAVDGSAAGRLATVRRMLVADGPAGPVLAPSWPDDWLGRGLEVHRAPTRSGVLSYAVRWHGARPALLWELAEGAPARLTTGLDPSWSTTDRRGEALLGPIEPPGGLPKVVAPLATGGTAVDDAEVDGPGFT